jgi:hypothetical protein
MDGVVNIADALAVAQYGVGLRDCGESPFAQPQACDVNPQPKAERPDLVPDGTCNIGDALKMAQCSVGLVSCELACRRFACPAVGTE